MRLSHIFERILLMYPELQLAGADHFKHIMRALLELFESISKTAAGLELGRGGGNQGHV